MASSDRTAGFGPLEGSKTALLTTFRPGGEAVGTPLSIAVNGNKAYFVTATDSGKARRLAHTHRVTPAPCNDNDTAPRAAPPPHRDRAGRLAPPDRSPGAPGRVNGPAAGEPVPGGPRRVPPE